MVLLATVLMIQHKRCIFQCKKVPTVSYCNLQFKKEWHRIKFRCDARCHKDVSKYMVDHINRTTGLPPGGYHCLLPKSLGARDPRYPQLWFARAPHQSPKSRAGAGPLPHTSTATCPTLGTANRLGLAGWCHKVILRIMGTEDIKYVGFAELCGGMWPWLCWGWCQVWAQGFALTGAGPRENKMLGSTQGKAALNPPINNFHNFCNKI